MLSDVGEPFRQGVKAASLDVSDASVPPSTESRPLSERALEVANRLTDKAISPVIVAGMVRMGDWLVASTVGASVYAMYLGSELGWSGFYFAIIAAVSTAAILVFQLLGLYTPFGLRSIGHQGARLIAGWTARFGVMLTIGFFTNAGDHVSRLWVGLWFVFGMIALTLFRGTVVAIVNQWTAAGRLTRNAAIIGGGPDAEKQIATLRDSSSSDLNLIGFFDDRGGERSSDNCAGLPKLGTVDDVLSFARIAKLDMLIVTLPISAEKRVLEMARKLWVLPIDVRLAAHTAKLRFRPRAYSYIGSVPFLAVFDRPLTDWDNVAKSLLDRIVGLAALIELSPVMLAAANAVKLDSKGPVLIKQQRFGFNNEPIGVYKFRSMYTDMCDTKATKLVTKGAPRVTRVGRFIRATSIAELPQLFNVVFKGNLSLVGPRPHAMAAKAAGGLYHDVVAGYFARQKVQPGIPGWAQVNGWRGETDTHEKIERRVDHDLYYNENWSL
ncbi:MAG: exopolysaccharide biosynthesis polyprenyl glycosylphosphotransferase [Cohaesibacteraceae bacterium]